jgi:hypothetical protein
MRKQAFWALLARSLHQKSVSRILSEAPKQPTTLQQQKQQQHQQQLQLHKPRSRSSRNGTTTTTATAAQSSSSTTVLRQRPPWVI